MLIMTDQQRADSLGYAHGGASDTPRLDRLAEAGVLFENAYSSATSCVPARSSLLTGLLPHRVPKVAGNARALTDSGLALKPGYWTIARALRAAGYQTALLGKMHLQPIRADHGFEVMQVCEHLPAGYAADVEDDYRRWLESTGRKDHRFVKPGTPKVFPYEADYHPTRWVMRHGLDFLDRRDPARPYFAVISFPDPHTPYAPPEPYASMYLPAEQALPATGIEVNASLTGPFRAAAMDQGSGRIFRPLCVDGLPRQQVQAVLAAIRAALRQIDDAVDRIMQHVDLDDTVVFFLSDHGDYGGHRGWLGKIPWIPFDDLAKVPFFAAGAGVAGGRRIRTPVQSFDYVASALELAGVDPPVPGMDAVSLVAVLRGGGPDRERPVFCSTGEGWPMIRRGRYKHIWHAGYDAHLLYDLQNDPIESVNLADDPAHAPLLAENVRILRRLLAKPVPDAWG